MLSCLCDGAYRGTIAVNRKELVAVGFITVVMAPMWHIALHNTNLYGPLVRSYSLGCCSQSSVEASGLNLFMYKLFGLVHICCHLGLYTLGHLGLYIFVAIWACTVWAIWACTYLLPFGPLHGRQITIIM